MVGDDIDDDAQAALVRLLHESGEVVQRSEHGIHRTRIAHVVARIVLRGRVERR